MTMRAVLLIDAGNSALKWQLLICSETDLLSSEHALAAVSHAHIYRMDNTAVSTEALVAAWRAAAAQLAADALPSLQWQMAWCAVGPVSVQQAVAQAYQRLSGNQAPLPYQSRSRMDLIGVGCDVVENRYQRPEQLGVDRWVSAIGLACQGVTGPSETHMIVSAGTATTVDLVCHQEALGHSQPEGRCLAFLGGWILPGFRLMNSALRSGTRDLDYTIAAQPLAAPEIPRDSQTAISQGIGLAQTGFVAGLIRHHHVTKLWLHGGEARDWRHWLAALDPASGPMITVHEQPALIFTGLMALARFQKSP